MGAGGMQPAAQAQQANAGAGGFSMDSFMKQLLPQLFGGPPGQQPAGFGSVAMPQMKPPVPFPQAPQQQVPNLMQGLQKTNQQLAQQHAMPFPPPPIRPTPTGPAIPTLPAGPAKPLSSREQLMQDIEERKKSGTIGKRSARGGEK